MNGALATSRRTATPRMPASPICVKRAYAAASRGDGRRVLVDRIWPRGIRRASLALEAWLKEVVPSDDLRRWFNHDPARWPAFVTRYRAEFGEPPASAALPDQTLWAS